MARRIRWLGVGMVVCFFLLFLQLNDIQVVKAHQYATDPDNPAVKAQGQQPRGDIQSADGQILAKSVRAPKDSGYKYERVYPEQWASALLRGGRGRLAQLRELRRGGVLQLLPGGPQQAHHLTEGPPHHRRPHHRHRHPHHLDHVAGGGPIGPRPAGGGGGGPRSADRGRPRHVLQPDLRPEPAGVVELGQAEAFAFTDDNTRNVGRLHAVHVAGLPGRHPVRPRVDLQDRHHGGRLRQGPATGEHPDPGLHHHPGQLLQGSGPVALQRRLRAAAAAPSPSCCPSRATPATPSWGRRSAPPA